MCGGFIGDVLDGIGDAVEGVVDGISDVLADVDDFVNDVIPGGWLGVGAGALLAVGIYNPTLLGLAEEGALTAEALAAEGIDAAALAGEVAAVAPETAAAAEAALATGAVTPEAIATGAFDLGEFAGVDAAVAANTAADAAAAAEAAAAAGGGIPVVDAVPSWINPTPTPDPTFFQGLKDFGGAVLESVGLGNFTATELAAMAAAGALAPSVLSALGLGGAKTPTKSTDSGGTFTVPEVDIPDLAVGGVNPGMLPITPMYKTTNDVQGQFYWGKQPYAATYADIAKHNVIPEAPKHAWGLQEAQQPFDVSAFIANTINPGAAAAMAGAPYPSYAVAGPVTPAELQPA